MSNTFNKNNSDSIVWQSALFDCLKHRVSEDFLLEHIDEILEWFSWLGKREGTNDDFGTRLQEQFTDSELRLRYEEFLDRLIVSNPSNRNSFFSRERGEAAVKRRHRQILSVFHPDKGSNDIEWLNYRVNTVNRAYESEFVVTESTSNTSLNVKAGTGPVRRKGAQGDKNKTRVIFDLAANDWRQKFGSSESVEKKVVFFVCASALAVFSLFLIAYFTSG